MSNSPQTVTSLVLVLGDVVVVLSLVQVLLERKFWVVDTFFVPFGLGIEQPVFIFQTI